MDSRTFVAVAGSYLLGVALAAAAQSSKIPRIGYVSGTGSATDQGPYVEALRQGLRDLGQIEGRNFSIEYRGAEGKLDRVPAIVDDWCNSRRPGWRRVARSRH